MKAADVARQTSAKQRADGKWWDGRCPAHEDQSASLSFADGDRGVIVKCHAGCTVDAIATGLGISVRQLFYANGSALARANGYHAEAPPSQERRIVATYCYVDVAGTLRYQVVRFEPKDFRQRRPDGRGGWTWNMAGVERLPYRLDELAERPRVYVPEGEKDADALTALGLAATCNEGGAGKWRPEHTAALVAVAVPEVVVLPDNDEAGEKHAALVAKSCRAAGLRVKILSLSALPPKGDVSDWLAAGHTAAQLEALADAVPALVGSSGASPELVDGPVLVQLSQVAPEAVSWAWPGRIPRGKLMLLIGEPGDGKTMTLCDMAARLTRGLGWPDGGSAVIGDVIISTAEDGIADTLRPRIDRQGGDPARVHILRGVRVEGAESAFSLERDLPALEQALTRTRAVVVGFDPLSAYLGSRDSYKDSEIRGILGPLAALAERTDVAVIGVLHLTKAAQRRLLNRAQGSIAFVAAARVVLAVGQDPNAPGRRLLVPIKNNLGPEAPVLAFRIGDSGLVWEPEPVPGSADALLAQDEAPTRSESRERDQAAKFLRDILRDGPIASKQVEADAKANGIAQRTLWRAKTDLGILTERAKAQDGKTAAWYWMLPVPERS